MTVQCPYCGSEDVYFSGVDDGGGDYGDSLCDLYECQGCLNDFEAHCISEDELNDGGTTDLTNTEGIEFIKGINPPSPLGDDYTDDIPF